MNADVRSDPSLGTVVVMGMGLMGGSLGRALKEVAGPPTVIGIDPDASQGRLAREAGAVDEAFESLSAVDPGVVDVVVFATPLRAAIALVGEQSGHWREDALITDLVSLKGPILRAAEAAGLGNRFVGAHPVCGGEGSGFAASRSGLFRDAIVWLCATEYASDEMRSRAERFWGVVGGRPRWIDAEEHDRTMAWASHLPQLVSNALAGALDSAGVSPEVLGPGGRDMTRLAGSSPEVWRDLLEVSAPATGTGLTSMSNALNVLADLLARRDLDRIVEFMERTRKWRGGE